MNLPESSRAIAFSAAMLGAFLMGCGGPNQANIDLRKQNQELREQVETLSRAREADGATIRALEGKVPTAPTLAKDRLDKLYTTHGITLGRLTGGWDEDANKPGDEGLRVQATPLDEDNQQLKAAGSFVVEAFDLALAGEQRIGRWEFDLAKSRAAWLGAAFQYNYLLHCPWQAAPVHEELTIKVTFRDELTGREFAAQEVVKVAIPGKVKAAGEAGAR